MKRSKFFKTVLTLIFTLCLVFGTAVISSAKGETKTDEPFAFSVHPEKAEYQKGEEIKFITSLHNRGAEPIENVMLIADVPKTETYLTRGTSEIQYKHIEAGEKIPGELKFSEYEAVLKIGAVIGSLSAAIASVYMFFVWQYNSIASLVVTLSMILTTAFAQVPAGSLAHLTAMRERQNLGTCKVVYDGEEYEFGFHASFEKKTCETAYAVKEAGNTDESFEVSATVKESANSMSGLLFGSEIENGGFDGYLFYINPETKTAGVLKKEGESFELLAKKKVSIEKNKAYEIKIVSDGKTAKCFLYNNSLDTEPYPIFDIPVKSSGNKIGTYTAKSGEVKNVTVSNYAEPEIAETYQNPVMPDGADPYVLYFDGTYYLYETNGYSHSGFEAYTSKDLVNWEYAGVVATKGDILGEYNFWAPEVYHYNGSFYLLYSAEEYTAVAVSDSPLGPFKKTSDNFIFDFRAIDGNLLFDDDGKIYMYFSKIRHDEGEGQQLWGCEMNSDLLSAKQETLTLLTEPNKEWEGWVNEGPFMLKHDGKYYLSYSGDFYFNIGYSVGYAVSDSPLGSFERYENNPVLSGNDFVHGTGHHAFVNSPDGSEMFIVYHCHNSTTEVHDRKICIDRAKFTKSENGADILTVYGPTVTAQPMPK